MHREKIVLSSDIVAWLEGNQHPGYARHLEEHQGTIKEALQGLGIAEASDLGSFYLRFGPFTARGGYELNEVDEIKSWTSYAQSELGVSELFLALTSIEGQGITLYKRTTGEVFDVEFGQFDELAAGQLQPVASSFQEYLRGYMEREKENP